ncbi:MAG TPA: hypothetical protein VFW34_07335 [Candidatus Rubrimentiphilum sp.]|nr:hypothetical protein [Candidatus Rubrimentiphilum sp.]
MLLVFMCALASAPLTAPAQIPVVLPAGDAPVVRVMMRSGTLTIRTWNRSDVQVASLQPVSARNFKPDAVARALTGSIPIFATSVFDPAGQITLPQEEFALTPLSPGPHQGVFVQALDADVVLTLPAGTALVLASVQRGGIDMQDYRGTFTLLLHNGPMRLRNVSGTGFAQVARGPLMIFDSQFDRLRARTAAGNIVFENCNSRQIQVSSVTGTIVYDGGAFQPGLARFETEDGSVALGISRDAQVGAHSSVGRIYSIVGGSSVRAGQTDAQIGNGRSVVTASSSHGAIFLYTGTLRSQQRLPAEWRPLAKFVQRRGPPRPPRGRIH